MGMIDELPMDRPTGGDYKFSGPEEDLSPAAALRKAVTKEEEPDKKEKVGLTIKDYLAISIAALETFLLPLVAIIAVMAVLVILFDLRL